MVRISIYVLLAIVGYIGYSVYGNEQRKAAERQAAAEAKHGEVLRVTPRPREIDVARSADPANSYRCDGRTTCSQMTSCQEATYFLKNCPNTKMDGDGDGIPCEQQLCKS